MSNERLRVVLEFNKNSMEDLKLYKRLSEFSHPASIVKDILKGLIPLSILGDQETNDKK